MRSRDASSSEPAGAHRPFESVTISESAPAASVARRDAERDRRVPEPRAVDVHLEPGGARRLHAARVSARRLHDPAGEVVGVLEHDRARVGAVVGVRPQRAADRVGGEQAVAASAPPRGITPERTAMPASSYWITWRALVGDHLLAGLA